MKLPTLGFLAKGKFKKTVNVLYLSFFGGIALFLLYLLAVNLNLFWLFGKMPGVDDLDNPKSEIASEIISSDGKVLGKFFYESGNRSPAAFEELSPKIIDALIATEDVRFDRHGGIDARSMLRVAKGLLTLSPDGGGSTITQQLAKNLFRLRNDESFEGLLYKIPVARTLVIKTKEWITAVKLERRYTKKEIMKMYLDTIEFSSGAHGIKSAAKTYFQKTPAQLTTNEAALLVGMIQNPSRFNPKFRPQFAKPRRNVVLAQMVHYGKLSKDEFDQLKEEEIELNYSPDSHNNGLAPYFRQFLKDWVKEEFIKSGYNPEDLYTKGFKIYTTIDSRMQEYAEEAMVEHMTRQQETFYKHWGKQNPWVQRRNAESSAGGYVEIPGFIEMVAKRTALYRSLSKKYDGNEDMIFADMNKKTEMTIFTWQGERDTLISPMDSIRHYKKFLNMSMLAMDPRNGHVKAWVGGINYKYFKYDMVAQSKRQPGSTFKPFVYVTAIDNGFSTCETVVDEPITFGLDDGVYGAPWTPKNANGKYTYQAMTLRSALAQSVNTVSARLIKQFKPESVIRMAHQLGIESELPNSPSLCLGVGEVSLYELVTSYSVFANGGKHTQPLFVTRIEDKNGQVIRNYTPDQKEVLSAESAYKMIHLMRASTQSGTSTSLGRYGILSDNEVAGKTGTTSNFSDGWFMGLTANLVAGVWSGADDRAIHFRGLEYGQGGRMALPAYGIFMQKVYADKSLADEYGRTRFDVPPGIRISGDCIFSPGESYAPSDSSRTFRPATIRPSDADEML
jgi:penicillin-binding protein 1A